MRKAATNSRQLIARSYRRAAIAATLAAALATTIAGGGESTATRDPAPAGAASELLARARARIDPRGKLDEIVSLRLKGIVEMDGAEVGRVETVAGREPRAMKEVLELAGTRRVTTLVGDEGWLEDPNGAVRKASGDELTTLRLAHELLFHRYLDGPSAGFDQEIRGTTLAILPRDGLERTLEFDESFLPARLTQSQHGTDVTVTFGDWREVDGLLFPFVSVQGTGDPRFDVTIRTTSVELAEDPPAIARPQGKAATDVAIHDPDAARRIAFESRAGLVFVDVEVGGKRGSFLLDTGAGATVLSSSFAAELGLEARGRLEARGAGGSEAAAFVDVPSLRLPGVELTDQTVVAIPLAPISKTLGHRVDGILGYDFISRFALEIDYAKRRLGLHPRGGYRPEDGAHRAELRIEANVPRVEGVVEGKHRGNFILDTGNSRGVILHAPFVKEHGLDARPVTPAAVAGIGGTESLLAVKIDSIALGELVFRDVTALISTADEGIAAIGESIGNLGGALFADAVLAMDYSEGALWVTVPAAASASAR